ncbi:MAG: hypothetical protein Q9160_000902 [Pyrenula sp. 1 TL-2023]
MAPDESTKSSLNQDDISKPIDSEAKNEAKSRSRDTISGDESTAILKTSRQPRRPSIRPPRKAGKGRQRKQSPPTDPAVAEAAVASPAALSDSERPPPRKLRPASQIISHLLHTPHLYHPSDFLIGYLDRFARPPTPAWPYDDPDADADASASKSSTGGNSGGEIVEIPLPLWAQQSSDTTNEEFIPMHRIRYVRHKDLGMRVWDREGRRDLLKESGEDRGDEEEEVQEFGDVFGCWK